MDWAKAQSRIREALKNHTILFWSVLTSLHPPLPPPVQYYILMTPLPQKDCIIFGRHLMQMKLYKRLILIGFPRQATFQNVYLFVRAILIKYIFVYEDINYWTTHWLLIWKWTAAPPAKLKMVSRGSQNSRWGMERCLPLDFWDNLWMKTTFDGRHTLM